MKLQFGGDHTKRREYTKNSEHYSGSSEFNANNEFPAKRGRITSEEIYSGFTEFNDDCVNELSSRVTGRDDDTAEQSVKPVSTNRRFFGVKAVTGTALKAAATFVVVGTAITTVALYNPSAKANKQGVDKDYPEYSASDYDNSYEYSTVPWSRRPDDYDGNYNDPDYDPYNDPYLNPDDIPEEQGTVAGGGNETPDTQETRTGIQVTRNGSLSGEQGEEVTKATRKSDSQGAEETVTKATKAAVTTTTQKATQKNAANCDHSYKLTSDTATCEKAGVKTYTCSKCKATKTEQSPAAGHDFKVSSTKEATCTQDGVKTYRCEKCKQTKTEAIKATGHDFQLTSTKKATCTQAGSKSYKCSKCKETKNETIPATGHNYQTSSESNAATCTANGVSVSVCSNCHDKKSQTIPALGHDYKTSVTKNATCTANGQKTLKCSRCGDTQTETIPATGHDMKLDSSKSFPSTCAKRGENHYKCSKCGYEDVEFLEAKEHTLTKSVVPNSANCQHGNIAYEKCRYCDYTNETYDNNIGNHKWVTDTNPAVTQPDKEGGWYNYYKCSVCGATSYEFEKYNY